MATYSYPLSMPTNVGFTQSQWRLKRAVAVTQSPFSGQQSVYEYSMALWQATLTLPPMKREYASEWQSFFLKLHGRRGTFLLGDPDAKSIRGDGPDSGTVTLSSAAAIGDDSVDISITAADSTVAFKAGDYIQLETGADAKLYMVVNDATVTSNAATLDIEPYLIDAVSSGATVDYTEPKGVFRMDANELGWDADQISRYGITFSCTEAL